MAEVKVTNSWATPAPHIRHVPWANYYFRKLCQCHAYKLKASIDLHTDCTHHESNEGLLAFSIDPLILLWCGQLLNFSSARATSNHLHNLLLLQSALTNCSIHYGSTLTKMMSENWPDHRESVGAGPEEATQEIMWTGCGQNQPIRFL